MIPTYLIFLASPIIMIPLPIYMACTLTGQFSAGIAYIVASLAYGTELLLPLIDHPGGIHSDYPRLSSVFSHRLSRGTVQRNEDTDTQSVEDYSTRCDVLFPGHIHFTFRVRDVPLFRKRKHVVIIHHPFSTACSDLYRIQSGCSMPRK